MYVDVINPVGMEECHTGAVVREILQNGFQFPLEQYTPEYYENSIVVGSLLTVPVAAALGVNRLSVDLVPFAFSFASLLLFMGVLRRGGAAKGLWFFVISFFFVSGTFIYLTMDSVGNHIIGLFLGALMLDRFFNAHVTRRPRYFYHFAFIAGISLFAHIGGLLYALLCAAVWALYRPLRERKPKLSAGTLLKGAAIFHLGAVPFIVFAIKTRGNSALYLLGVVGRRSTVVRDWAAYAQNNFKQFLFQFDDRLFIAILYLVPVIVAWAAWIRIRKVEMPEGNRLLLFIACLFPVPALAAVVVFSGGEFTTYYTYALPLLFLTGAVFFARLADSVDNSETEAPKLQFILSLMLLVLLGSGTYVRQINLSAGHAWRELTATPEKAICYWRFGRSFGNYTPYRGDPEKYAKDILAACGRLNSREKRAECLWGWSVLNDRGEFVLDRKAANALGGEAAGLIARSMGGWSGSINSCLGMDPALVDDCILGIVERNAVNLYSFSPPGKPFVRIPCLPDTPRFTGLVQSIRGEIKLAPWADRPQNCPPDINMLCVMADAYCAASREHMNFCDTGYTKSSDIDLCHFVFWQVWNAKLAERQLQNSPGLTN